MEKKSVLLVWWRKIVNHFCKSEVEKRIEETECLLNEEVDRKRGMFLEIPL